MNFLNPFITKIWDVKDYNVIYQYKNPFGAGNGIDISKDTSFIAIGNAYILTLLNSHWNPTKVEDNTEPIKILYPNPSGNMITIPLDKQSKTDEINIININGLIIKKINNIEPYINILQIDISMFQIGTYFVNINYNNKVISYKFEKAR